MSNSRPATDRLAPVFIALAVGVFAAWPFVVGQAPVEASMGFVSKIFYVHLPAAMMMLLSTFVCGIASAMYLARRRPAADAVALAAAELVVLFGIVVLVTGPLWARKAWGVWWAWEARLTMTLVMWMVFVAYLLLRRFGGAGAEVLAAAVGIFGMAVAPFVYWSVDLWRTMHPQTTVVVTLPASMAWPIWFGVGGFLCLYLALLFTRVRLERARVAIEDAWRELDD